MSHKNYKDLEPDELVEIVGPSKDEGKETNTIPTISAMKKPSHIENESFGKCLVLWESTFPKATTSVHLHFCSLCPMDLLVLKPETILPQ